jgi:putative transposase
VANRTLSYSSAWSGTVPGGSFFFTVTVTDRRSSVLVDCVGALREAIRKTRHERPFAIEAIVILPDHFHTIMSLPQDDADFSGRLRRIKSLFTHRLVTNGVAIEQNQRGEYSLWQSRFWEHTLRDETDVSRHVDYIHFNPVKHRLVTRVSDWPYSSFHRYVRQGLLPADWGGTVETSDGHFGERRP